MSRKKYNNKSFEGRYIAVPYSMFESVNYKTLSSRERDVLMLFKYRYNGTNNGEIHLTAREIANWYGWSKSTAHKATVTLYERGFIKPHKLGNFTNRLGTTWILNFERHGNNSPTNEWKSYDEKQKKVPDIEPYRFLERTI